VKQDCQHFAEIRWVLVLLLSAFGIFGLWAGCFTVLLADLSRALGLSPGPLGAALFAGAGASIAAMASLGWSADRFGRKTFLVVVTCLFACGIVGLAFAGNFVALVVVFTIVFPGGLYDVGINAVAVDLEQNTGRRLMSFLHAAYSGGAVLGALGAGLLLWVGLDYRLVYLLLLVPLAALMVAFAAARLPQSSGGVHEGGPSEANAEGSAQEGRWDLYRSAPLLLVAAIAVFGLLAEGEMGHWSGIYLRDSLGMGALLGGSGVAVFYGAMALGRLATGWTVGLLGNRHTLLGAGLLITLGMSLALPTRTRPSRGKLGGSAPANTARSGARPRRRRCPRSWREYTPGAKRAPALHRQARAIHSGTSIRAKFADCFFRALG
jgi:MFS family permease